MTTPTEIDLVKTMPEFGNGPADDPAAPVFVEKEGETE